MVGYDVGSEKKHITFKTVSGESKSVTPEMVDGWWETSLPTFLSNYEVKDIYNADEFGLFYEFLPNKSYQFKSEKCNGGTLSKIRITVENAFGDKLPMFVIGKTKKSRCFKNEWMDGVLFEEWIRVMDKKFVSEGRKIALVINNCPAHPQIENLKLIKLFSSHRTQLLRIS